MSLDDYITCLPLVNREPHPIADLQGRIDAALHMESLSDLAIRAR